MTASLPPVFVFRAFDAAGSPLVGGKLYSYAATTLTPMATYSDQGMTPNTNPVILDANGQCSLWIGSTPYKFDLTDENDVQQPGYPVDNVSSPQNIANSVLLDLASTSDIAKGDALIGVKQPFTGTVARTQHSLNREHVSLVDFTDLKTALESGAERIYVPKGYTDITTPVTATLTNSLILFGEGTIRYTGLSSTANLLTVALAGFDLTVDGISFEGQNLIAGGPRFDNYSAMTSPLPIMRFNNGKISNFKMNSASPFNLGLYIYGSYEEVEISGNRISNITRLAGTGTPGSSGTVGAGVVFSDATHYAKAVHHHRNQYENISGDDALASANNVDHDGFLFFCPPPSSVTNSDGTIFRYVPAVVESHGNSYKNCRGRAVKVQGIANVYGEKIIRDAGYTNFGGSTEINLQWGVGRVSDIDYFYTDYNAGASSPIQSGLELVSIFRSSWYGEDYAGTVISGLTVYNSIKAGVGSNISAVLGATVDATAIAKRRPLVVLENVAINRGTINFIVTTTVTSGSYGMFRLDNIVIDKLACGAVGIGDTNVNVEMIATGVIHLDAVVTPGNVKRFILDSSTVPGGPIVERAWTGRMSGALNRGFTESYAVGIGFQKAPMLSGGALSDPAGFSGGAASVQSKDIADDETYTFAARGFNAGRGIVSLSTAFSLETQGVMCVGDGKVAVVAAPAGHLFSPSVVIDTNPDVDGRINVWMTSAGTISIKNRLGSTRTFTMMYVG